MLNHSPEAGCAFTYDDTDEPPSFVVELPDGKKAGEMLRTPESGEQLWLDYGAQTSEELWLMYGFVPSKPTPHDSATLTGAYAEADVDGAPGDAAMMEEKRERCRQLVRKMSRQAGYNFIVGTDGSKGAHLAFLGAVALRKGSGDVHMWCARRRSARPL